MGRVGGTNLREQLLDAARTDCRKSPQKPNAEGLLYWIGQIGLQWITSGLRGCLHHLAGARSRGVPAGLNAWPGDLVCVFCNLMAAIDYAIANGMDRDKAEAAG